MNCAGQCEGCAFKKGADANLEIDNMMTGALAALAGNPFYCHDTLRWQVPANEANVVRNNPAVMRAELLAITLPGKEPRACAGWKAAVFELAAKGWFRGESAPLRRYFARQALRSLIAVRSNSSYGVRPTRVRNREMKALAAYMVTLAEDVKSLGVNPERIGLA